MAPSIFSCRIFTTRFLLSLYSAVLLLFVSSKEAHSFITPTTTTSIMPGRATHLDAPSTTSTFVAHPSSSQMPMRLHPTHRGSSTTVQLYKSRTSSSDVNNDDGNLAHKNKGLSLAAKVASVALFSTVLAPSAAHAADGAQALFSSFSQTGFYQAFSLVFLSELGDKTFFIAGLLAMKTSRWISFVGSIGALAVMTVLSVLIGQIFHAVPAGIADGIPLDDLCAVAAFLFFGIKILSEALAMDENAGSVMDEERKEAEETVEDTDTVNRNSLSQIATIFGLVFAAELGDRSFLSTIALSAAQSPVAVALGAVAAHAVATGIAVASGAVVAKYLSERVIGIIGGSLFLIFAATTAVGIF